jgi:hypothetical protein
VNEVATRNTARVIADVGADVLAVIEADDRPALDRFNRDLLPVGFEENGAQPRPYRHVMLVDGNDDRGIDVGLLTARRYPIETVRSHVDDRDAKDNPIFSRDCAEYQVPVPNGDPRDLERQAAPAGAARGEDLRPAPRGRLEAHRGARRPERHARQQAAQAARGGHQPEGRLRARELPQGAAHRHLRNHEQQDRLLLLSPDLFATVQDAGLNRKGVWHGPKVKNPWEMLDTMERDIHQASDHAAIWADLKL